MITNPAVTNSSSRGQRQNPVLWQRLPALLVSLKAEGATAAMITKLRVNPSLLRSRKGSKLPSPPWTKTCKVMLRMSQSDEGLSLITAPGTFVHLVAFYTTDPCYVLLLYLLVGLSSLFATYINQFKSLF